MHEAELYRKVRHHHCNFAFVKEVWDQFFVRTMIAHIASNFAAEL